MGLAQEYYWFLWDWLGQLELLPNGIGLAQPYDWWLQDWVGLAE
jgi:hypothetical protein